MSSKAKACPKCGAKPQKKTSLVTWLVLIFIVLIVYFANLSNTYTPSNSSIKSATGPTTTNQAKTTLSSHNKIIPIIDVLSISGKTKVELGSILGSPKSCTSIKYGEKCEYSKARTEIVFINNKADWITVNQLNNIPYSADALEFIGIPKSSPSFSNDNVMRWKNINGFLEIAIFPSGKKVNYAYIKVKTN